MDRISRDDPELNCLPFQRFTVQPHDDRVPYDLFGWRKRKPSPWETVYAITHVLRVGLGHVIATRRRVKPQDTCKTGRGQHAELASYNMILKFNK